MIGSRVAFEPPRPYGGVVSLAVAAVVGALVVALGAAFLVPLSLPPAAIGVCLLVAAGRAFRARFTASALEIARPRLSIPYSSILEVRPLVPLGAARPLTFAMDVVYQGGSIVLPSKASTGSERVYSFLRDRLAERPARGLPSALEVYRKEQEQAFGPDRVWSYGARHASSQGEARWLRPAGVGLLICGLGWMVLPILRPGEPAWYGAGAAALFAGAVLLVVASARRAAGRRAAKAGESTTGLVISPVGLAMEQGALKGLLTWQEIRKVTVRAAPARFALSGADRLPGITLDVEGATIRITDSYDRTLGEIYERIQRYWR